MRIEIPYPPQANHAYTVARGRKILSAKGRAYKADVAKRCLIARIKPLEGDLSVTLWVYRPRKAGDLDNTMKLPLDAIKGFAYHDDKQIVELHAYRRDDKENPRIEVMVNPVIE